MNIHDTIAFQSIGLPEDILQRKLWGDFDGAIRLIDRRLAETNIPKALRHSLIFHREIILRTPEQFPYSREEALAIIREKIADYTEEEFDEALDARRIRWHYVKGKIHVTNSFFSTLCKADPALAKRAGVYNPANRTDVNPLDIVISEMKAEGAQTRRIRIRASVKVKDEVFKPGMFIRAHLPIPAACHQQRDIRIERVFPENGMIAPVDAAQRTVCWEENMAENHEFMVEYSYLHTEKYTDAYHLAGKPGVYDFDLQEQAPHIVFSPYIKAIVAELTDGLTDPMAKARAFYDFITLNMKYTYMPDYFTLDSIAESCARNFNGDCGVFALLFITLCRCAGIPAQWQSALTAEPEDIGCHDWARFYVEPYGWLCADPSYGTGAVRAGSETRRQFYFGNIDPFRMVANRECQANFTVPKQFWRCDPYDNQSGEMETDTFGLQYHQYTRRKEILLCEKV